MALLVSFEDGKSCVMVFNASGKEWRSRRLECKREGLLDGRVTDGPGGESLSCRQRREPLPSSHAATGECLCWWEQVEGRLI